MAELPYRIVPSSSESAAPVVIALDTPMKDGGSIVRHPQEGHIVISGTVAESVVLEDFIRAAESTFARADRLGWTAEGVSRLILPPLKNTLAETVTIHVDSPPEVLPGEAGEAEDFHWTNCVGDREIHETNDVARPLSTAELEELGFDATGFSFMRLDLDRMTLCYAPALAHFESGFYLEDEPDHPGIDFAAEMLAPGVKGVATELRKLLRLLG